MRASPVKEPPPRRALHHPRGALSLVLLIVAGNAEAYRPFDSTDADVAAKNELELEFGGSTLYDHGVRDSAVPAVTLNFGAGHDREFSIDGGLDRISGIGEDTRTRFVDPGLTVKQILRRGSLQGESGASLAGACSLLIPTRSEEAGFGGALLFVASRQWTDGALHLDLGVAYDPSREWRAGFTWTTNYR